MRILIALAIPCSLAAGGCGLGVGAEGTEAAGARLVFGDDDRRESFDHPAAWLRGVAEHSAMAMIAPGDLDDRDPTRVRLDADVETVGERLMFCDDVAFREQPAAANCSATLIDAQHVLTAGHCLGGAGDCADYAFVFGYRYAAAGELAPMDAEDVYYCRQRIVYDESDLIDHAIIELDRPVHPRHHPAPVRFEDTELARGTPVATASFGQGIPAKLDDQGHVTTNAVEEESGAPKYFEETLDTFPGSSGAGVYTHDGRVAGVHVRGASSYQKDGLCFVLSTSYDDWTLDIGGDASHVGRAMADLCDVAPTSALCVQEGSLCRDCGACVEGDACATLSEDPSTTYCAASCEAEADCAAGLTCRESECVPADRCHAGHVWALDPCGRPAALVDECGEDEVCPDGAPACVAAGVGNSCASAEPIDAVTQVLEGSLRRDAYRSNSIATCGGLGQDRVYAFTVEEPVAFEAEATGFDAVLSLRTTCADPGTELACRDDTTPPGDKGARLSLTLEPGTHYLVLDSDGFTPLPGGDFELSLAFEALAEPTPDGGDEADAGAERPARKSSGGGCAVALAPGRGSSLLGLALLAMGFARLRRQSRTPRTKQ